MLSTAWTAEAAVPTQAERYGRGLMSAPFFLRHSLLILRPGGGCGCEVGSSSVSRRALHGLDGRGRPSIHRLMTYDIALIAGGLFGLSVASQAPPHVPPP